MFSLPKVTQLFHDKSIGPVKITPVILRVVLKNDGVRTANNFVAVRARHYYVLYYPIPEQCTRLYAFFYFFNTLISCASEVLYVITHTAFFFFFSVSCLVWLQLRLSKRWENKGVWKVGGWRVSRFRQGSRTSWCRSPYYQKVQLSYLFFLFYFVQFV